jgi:hypothetical protein
MANITKRLLNAVARTQKNMLPSVPINFPVSPSVLKLVIQDTDSNIYHMTIVNSVIATLELQP